MHITETQIRKNCLVPTEPPPPHQPKKGKNGQKRKPIFFSSESPPQYQLVAAYYIIDLTCIHQQWRTIPTLAVILQY